MTDVRMPLVKRIENLSFHDRNLDLMMYHSIKSRTGSDGHRSGSLGYENSDWKTYEPPSPSQHQASSVIIKGETESPRGEPIRHSAQRCAELLGPYKETNPEYEATMMTPKPDAAESGVKTMAVREHSTMLCEQLMAAPQLQLMMAHKESDLQEAIGQDQVRGSNSDSRVERLRRVLHRSQFQTWAARAEMFSEREAKTRLEIQLRACDKRLKSLTNQLSTSLYMLQLKDERIRELEEVIDTDSRMLGEPLEPKDPQEYLKITAWPCDKHPPWPTNNLTVDRERVADAEDTEWESVHNDGIGE